MSHTSGLRCFAQLSFARYPSCRVCVVESGMVGNIHVVSHVGLATSAALPSREADFVPNRKDRGYRVYVDNRGLALTFGAVCGIIIFRSGRSCLRPEERWSRLMDTMADKLRMRFAAGEPVDGEMFLSWVEEIDPWATIGVETPTGDRKQRRFPVLGVRFTDGSEWRDRGIN